MRTYGQFCAVAKALDVVGDRWTLLIVRELLTRERCRYADLKSGLPGIASNLLAERLKELEGAGIVLKETAPLPIGATVYALTSRGKELRPVVAALGRWAGPLMSGPATGDVFKPHWFALPGELYLEDRTPAKPPVTIELRTEDDAVTLMTDHGRVRARLGAAERPDAVLRGPPHLILAVLMGRIPLKQARARGLECDGSARAVGRLRRTQT
jgi:DNA-binding HxlR family transcriptional regulator